MTRSFSDRPAVKRRIVEVLTHAAGLKQVQVEYSNPQARTRNEAVWLGNPTGNREPTDFGVPRQGTDDRWNLELAVAVTGFATETDADSRCQEIVNAVDAALFQGDRLGVSWPATYPGAMDGPTGFRLAPTEPCSSIAFLTIEIVASLRGA